jgi:hypothetical protein
MIGRFLTCSALITVAIGLQSSACGGVVYNEAVNGPFSSSGLSPTPVGPLSLGDNDIFGTTGSGTSGVKRDYFTITVPAGTVLNSIIELPGTQVAGSFAFFGVQAGPQVTVSPTATSAAGLLGWRHYGPADINTNILPEMAIPAAGSSGFTPPLGPGQYSFWVQELGTGSFPFGFDLALAPAASVPEPSSWLLGLFMLVPLACRLRRTS